MFLRWSLREFAKLVTVFIVATGLFVVAILAVGFWVMRLW